MERRKETDGIIREQKAAFLRAKIAEMDPNQDMWDLIRVLVGRKPPAKPAEPLQRHSTSRLPGTSPTSNHGPGEG